MKNAVFTLILVLLGFAVNGQHRADTFEFRSGIEGQFYLKEKYVSGIWMNQTGSSGRAASIGLGIPIILMWNIKKFSLSVTPVVRYAKIESISPVSLEEKWGFIFDSHFSAQYNISGQGWLLKNVSIGGGFSILNIGPSFDTYYNWSFDPSFNPNYEYQAENLLSYGVHGFYEKQLGDKFFVKFMITYSKSEWVKWYPLTELYIYGTVSISYRILGR